MSLQDLSNVVLATGRFSCRIDEGLLRIVSTESGSEYVAEPFGSGLQVRQACLFGCSETENLQAFDIAMMCTRLNERFSGCKSYIDSWDVLVTAFDVLELTDDTRLISTVLDQVEFISQATLALIEAMQESGPRLSDEQIDRALEIPSLQ
jgi:hypothetical protein